MDERERARLVALIRKAAVPLEPVPPELSPEWQSLVQTRVTRTYRALLFDVYGTLFCSGVGDIGTTVDDSAVPAALDSLAAEIEPRLSGEELRRRFRQKIAEIHAREAARTQWPEVRVDEEIWLCFLRERECETNSAAARELALRYELAVNPVYPMPGAARAIAALKKSGCVLGIISNAQFFTPLLFDAFFGGAPETCGFSPDLLFYSYEYGDAKPSPLLFNAARARLEARGIAAADCAVIGNDMRSDIYGAVTAGFHGILFAGDSRSLRLREGDALTGALRPSCVIRGLDALGGAQ